MTPATAAFLQRLLPQRALCSFIYKVARSRRRWLKTPLIAWFARHYRIDLDEAATRDLDAYASFNEFFTRALKPGARPVDARPDVLVSPVDGRLTQYGTITNGRLVQAKGLDYAVQALLGESSPEADAMVGGEFATIYLAPHNYHRVHAPLAGRWVRTRYVPGARFSVNAATTAGVADLFCRNERAVCWFEGELGPFAVVLVGALNVSSVSTVTRGEIPSGRAAEWHEPPGTQVAKGDEIGRFNLGSTVVLVLPPGSVRWRALAADTEVRLGSALAELTARS